jgi:hypothetical protein
MAVPCRKPTLDQLGNLISAKHNSDKRGGSTNRPFTPADQI